MLTYVNDSNYNDEWDMQFPCEVSYDPKSHSLTLMSTGQYVCTVCGNIIVSPIIEDFSVLSIEDYRKIQSLYICSGILRKLQQDGGIAGNYTEYVYLLPLKLADEIRAKDAYDGNYTYSDLNGKCYAVHDYLYDPIIQECDCVFLQKKCNYYSDITSLEALTFNGILENAFYTALGIFGLFAPSDIMTALLYSASSTSAIDDINNLMDTFIDYIPDNGTKHALSLVYNLIVFGATSDNNAFCKKGDNVVKISLVDSLNREYIFNFAFDSDGVIIGQAIDIGYAYN